MEDYNFIHCMNCSRRQHIYNLNKGCDFCSLGIYDKREIDYGKEEENREIELKNQQRNKKVRSYPIAKGKYFDWMINGGTY